MSTNNLIMRPVSPTKVCHERRGIMKRSNRFLINSIGLAAAAGFAAMHAYEAHVRASGQEVSHAKMKEFLAAIAAAEVDKLVETKGLDWVDRHKAHKMAEQQAHYLAENRYGADNSGWEYARGRPGPRQEYAFGGGGGWQHEGYGGYGGGPGYGGGAGYDPAYVGGPGYGGAPQPGYGGGYGGQPGYGGGGPGYGGPGYGGYPPPPPPQGFVGGPLPGGFGEGFGGEGHHGFRHHHPHHPHRRDD
ncbi:hypothetical protein SCHPADRAFT_282314 [Schizopora paradoxa]|uniref:Uncharacterized protein n=1 Tax=Schizopora paradoxa TaxID=27342 RepID=A0A0H2SDQ4_9AGAM|nr:hypothetical protein SCHPADRAFT_282314 [Schizopora paradoxa]